MYRLIVVYSLQNPAELNLAQHEQYEVTKLLMKLVKEIETRLNCINQCCNRFVDLKLINGVNRLYGNKIN